MKSSSSSSSKEHHASQVVFQRGDRISKGNFCEVYLCLNTETTEIFAVKKYLESDELPEKEIQRLRKLEHNARVLSRIPKHINIVQYYGIEKSHKSVSIFMEYVPGGNIRTIVDRFGQLEERIVQKYTSQMLTGMSHLHHHCVTHGGLTNKHVYVGSDGTIKIGHTAGALGASLDMVHVRENKNDNDAVEMFCIALAKDLLALAVMILEMSNADMKEACETEKMLKQMDFRDSEDYVTLGHAIVSRTLKSVEHRPGSLTRCGMQFVRMLLKQSCIIFSEASRARRYDTGQVDPSTFVKNMTRHPFIARRGITRICSTWGRFSESDVLSLSESESSMEFSRRRLDRLPDVLARSDSKRFKNGSSSLISSNRRSDEDVMLPRIRSVQDMTSSQRERVPRRRQSGNHLNALIEEAKSVKVSKKNDWNLSLNSTMPFGRMGEMLSSSESDEEEEEEEEQDEESKELDKQQEKRKETKKDVKTIIRQSSSRKWTQRAFLSRYGATPESSPQKNKSPPRRLEPLQDESKRHKNILLSTIESTKDDDSSIKIVSNSISEIGNLGRHLLTQFMGNMKENKRSSFSSQDEIKINEENQQNEKKDSEKDQQSAHEIRQSSEPSVEKDPPIVVEDQSALILDERQEEVEYDIDGRPVVKEYDIDGRLIVKESDNKIEFPPFTTLSLMWYLEARIRVRKRWYTGETSMNRGQNQRCSVANARVEICREKETCENSWFQGIQCEEDERLVVYDMHDSGWCIVCNTSGRYGWIRQEYLRTQRPSVTTTVEKEMTEKKENVVGIVNEDEAIWNWGTEVENTANEVILTEREEYEEEEEEEEEKEEEKKIEDETYTNQESATGYCVRMVSNYENENQDDEDGQRLVAASGDLIQVIEEHESGWWCGQIKGGERDGELGWFPCSFVEWADPVGGDETTGAQGEEEDENTASIYENQNTIKLHDKTAASTFGLFEDSSQISGSNVVHVVGFVRVLATYVSNDEELGLEEGSVIAVLETQESGWWYGRKVASSEDEFNRYEAHLLLDQDQSDDSYGWFPCNFTEWIEEEEEKEEEDEQEERESGSCFEVEDEFVNYEKNEEEEEEERKEEAEIEGYYATVVANYIPEEESSSGQLALDAGDVVCVLKSDDSGWCFGYVYNEDENGDNVSEDMMGWFPETYLDWGEEIEEELEQEEEEKKQDDEE